MASRPRPTLADYVVIALSPALIMLLVGSLVFFLIEIFYRGDYDGRLSVILALFVFAAVLIARISIENSREYAALFALPLAGATAVALNRFVSFSGPLSSYSLVINLGLMALIWWCADKLTWDSTVIDDSQDATGEGLLQTAGLDEDATSQDAAGVAEEAQRQPAPSPWQRFVAYRRQPHAPGLWVIYFSMAALPIFGFGHWFVPSEDLAARRYVFQLLVVYVGAGLGLLLTTSFLSLRRYLRQRRLEMPASMTTAWMGTGAAMIVGLLLVCTLLPRRNPEYSVTQLPFFAGSPTDLWTTPNSVGNEGQHDPEKGDRPADEPPRNPPPGSPPPPKSPSDSDAPRSPNGSPTPRPGGQDDPGDAPGGRSKGDDSPEGSDPGGSSQGDQPGKGPKGDQPGDDSPGDKPSSGGEKAGDSPKSDPSKSDPSKSDPSKSDPSKSDPSKSDPSKSDEPKESPKGEPQSESEVAESPPQQKFDFSKIPQAIGGTLGNLLKFLYWAIVVAGVAYVLWRYWRQVVQAVSQFWKSIQDFFASLFGRAPAAAHDEAPEVAAIDTSPSFASFHDPFLTGMSQQQPAPAVIRYSFQAFEAWARERGLAREPDQTAHEFALQIGGHQPAVARDAATLADLYNRCAFGRDGGRLPVEPLRALWQKMQS